MTDGPIIKPTLAGDWAEPANTLIKKCSQAVGGLFKPWQIRRIAKAEVDAEITLASGQIEISEMQRRAAYRFLTEETQKQANMEGIVLKALPEVKPDAQSDKVENDWIANFFDKCRLISDEQMQGLWAKILAGEANSPGNFSKRTVNLVGNLDKADAFLFSQLCRFIVDIRGRKIPVVFDWTNALYKDAYLHFGSLSHLDATGLITFSSTALYERTELPQRTLIEYFGERFILLFPEGQPKYQLSIGHVLPTLAGAQLQPICEAQPQEGFVAYLGEFWKKWGITMEVAEE